MSAQVRFEEKLVQKEIKKIGVLSCGVMSAAIYFVFGIVYGLFFFLFWGAFSSPYGGDRAFLQLIPLVYPILLAIMGFIGGVVVAALYNFFTMFISGIKVKFTVIEKA